jgi:hypothetical protein
MAHPVDKMGFPLDPQLRRLEGHLGYLAAIWRETHDPKILKEYYITVKLLYELGWDGTIDFESMLPPEHMPPEFMDRQKAKEEAWLRAKSSDEASGKP